jgi:hypothetical protein
MYNYCTRVRRAIRKLIPRFVVWPDRARRLELSQAFDTYGFPGCLGIVDGSLIPLTDKPLVDGPVYFCRKGFYAVSTLIRNVACELITLSLTSKLSVILRDVTSTTI